MVVALAFLWAFDLEFGDLELGFGASFLLWIHVQTVIDSGLTLLKML